MEQASCRAVILAKYISQDRLSQMYSIAGIYHAIWAPEFPWKQHAILVYAQLLDVEVGEHKTWAQIEDPDGRVISATRRQTFEVGRPDVEFGMDYGFDEVEVKGPGRHEVHIIVDGVLAGAAKLAVRQMSPEDQFA